MEFNIFSVLETIRKRPAMYVGQTSLKNIHVFLSGYLMAMMEIGATDLTDPGFGNFHDWIANKFGYRESTAGWPNMILAAVIGCNPQSIEWESYDSNVTIEQHIESVAVFYKLLDEYKLK